MAEKRGGKGLELLRCFYQPVQDGIGGHLEHAGGSANAQPLGQAREHADDQLHSDPFAMKNGAMMLWKVAVAGGAVELPPRTTARMPIGTEIPQSYPAAIVAVDMGAEMPGGIDLTRPTVCRGHRVRLHRWRGHGM